MTTPSRRISPGPIIGSLAALLAVFGLVAILFFLPRPGPGDLVGPSGSPTPTPEPTLNQALLNRRLTVLVIGIDSSEGRRARGAGTNTDAMILASVNAAHTRVTFISIPRDTVDVPLPDGTIYGGKLNGLEASQGVEALVGAVETLLEVDLDGYVQIDMDGMQALIDAAGGVEVNAKQALVDPALDLDIPAGRQVLDGATAMGYLRERYSTSDFARARRQHEVLFELVRRLVARKTDGEIGDLLGGLELLETDLPLKDLPTLIEIGRQSRDAQVQGIVFTPPKFFTFAGIAGERGYILQPNIEAMRAKVAQVLAD
jgi:LCP family protein required for cell wall assembly